MIIAASNFRIEKIEKRVRLDAKREVAINGYAIMHRPSGKFVSLNSKIEDISVPTTYPMRGTAEAVISEGLLTPLTLLPL